MDIWMRALAGALGVMMAGGCGSDDLRTGAGPVDEETATAFLVDAEATWRGEAGAGQTQNLPAEARCYLVTDGGRLVSSMACGPVRRLGTSDGAVWDVVRIEGTGGGLRIAAGEQWQRSVARPPGGGLTRPDGRTPAVDADMLAPPPAPPAASRLVLVQDQIGGNLAEHNTALIGPDVTVTLTGLGSVDTIGTGNEVKGPAAGERFLVARFSVTETSDPLFGGPDRGVPTRFAVAADADPRPVELITRDRPDLAGQGYLIASVPTGAKEVTLTATNRGVTQSVSLLSGRRTSTGVAEAFYRTNRSATLDRRMPARRIAIGRDFDARYGITLTRAGLSAWDDRRGWAPTGRAWFRFRYDESWDQPSALYDVSWNPRFFTATADGRPIALPTEYNTYTRTLTAPVPAGVKRIRITVAAWLTFAEHPDTSYAQPKSGRANFGTLVVDVPFG